MLQPGIQEAIKVFWNHHDSRTPPTICDKRFINECLLLSLATLNTREMFVVLVVDRDPDDTTPPKIYGPFSFSEAVIFAKNHHKPQLNQFASVKPLRKE